jgi:hypothetical protein
MPRCSIDSGRSIALLAISPSASTLLKIKSERLCLTDHGLVALSLMDRNEASLYLTPCQKVAALRTPFTWALPPGRRFFSSHIQLEERCFFVSSPF